MILALLGGVREELPAALVNAFLCHAAVEGFVIVSL